MEDREKREDEVARGKHAQRILEDELVVEAFDTWEKMVITTWRGTKFDETRKREDLYHQLKAFEAMKRGLTSVMRTGRLANEQLSDEAGNDDGGTDRNSDAGFDD